MTLIKGEPFRFKGTKNVEDCKTSEEVMIKSGLDWEVDKCELYGKMPSLVEDASKKDGFLYRGDYYNEVNNNFAIYRTDHNIPLGIVKGRYTPVQNSDAFKFFDNAIGKNEAIWQTAGYFGRGERIFVSAKLPKNIMINGKDPVENYLVFTTSHDGSSGVKILLTPIRVVCKNTLNSAIRLAKKSATNYISFRHTSSVHDNIDTAHEILKIAGKRIEEIAEDYNFLAKKRLTEKQVVDTFANIILTEQEIANITYTGHNINKIINRDWRAIEDSGISMKKVNTLNSLNNYYYQGPGQKEFLGTGWGVYGAISGYYSNVDNAEGEKRMDSLLYGDKSRKIELAGNILINI